MDLTLTAVFEEIPQAEGGGFVAYTEELPGAITQGETLEEARENLRDAIEIKSRIGQTASSWSESYTRKNQGICRVTCETC